MIPTYHPVIRCILERKRRGSGIKDDKYKIGLVVEGGGMRGAVSAGILFSLYKMGLSNCFDAIYAASAGAFNAAYFLSRQERYGLAAYYQSLNSRGFVNKWRFFAGKPVVNLDFIMDFITKQKPLDVDRVLTSPTKQYLIVTNAETIKSEALTDFRTSEDYFNALVATSAIPILTESPRLYQGKKYFDAMLSEPTPIYTAMRHGCTHVLVALSRPLEAERPPLVPIFDRIYQKMLLRQYGPAILAAYLKRSTMYKETSDFLVRATKDLNQSPSIYTLAPSLDSPTISRTELRRDRLLAGIQSGISVGLQAFGITKFEVFECLDVFLSDRLNVSSWEKKNASERVSHKT